MATNFPYLTDPKTFNGFVDELIGKIFKVLPLYESYTVDNNDIIMFNSYLDKLTTLLMGCGYVYNCNEFTEIAIILQGVNCRKHLSKSQVKSIVFHCIGLLEKTKKKED